MQRHAVHDVAHAELAHAVGDVVAAFGHRLRTQAVQPGQLVRLEPVRSAEPPTRSGSVETRRLDGQLRRLAGGEPSRPWPASCQRGFALGQPSRRADRPSCGGSNSAASSGNCAARIRTTCCSHFSWRFAGVAGVPARRARRRRFRTAVGPCRCARVAAISSLPSGAPCTSCVPALFGEPLPMIVLQQISVGLAFCALAAAIPRSTASTSWPSTSRQ
jgi:hypothetical protein